MRKYLLFATAIVGLAVSGYLFVAYTTGGPITCGVGHGCDTVRASEYSSFFGIPTPVFGLIFYLLMAIGVIIKRWDLLKWLTLGGLIVSGYLTYLEAFVINAWCFWCVVSAILSVVAFVIVWLRMKGHDNGE